MTFVEILVRQPRAREIMDWMDWQARKEILDADQEEILFAAKCSQCGCEGPRYTSERGSALLALDAGWLLTDAGFRGNEFTYYGEGYCCRCRDEFST